MMNPTRVRFTVQDLLRGKASGLFIVRAVEIVGEAGGNQRELGAAVRRIAKMAALFLSKEDATALEQLAQKIDPDS